jgi:CheY-like chemotaxis protein
MAVSTLRLLVVDDNKDSADVTALMLKRWGHDVCLAHSGKAAMDAAIAFRPNVVLLDIGLPDMSGYELASQFRRDGQLNNVQLVAVTGYGEEDDQLRFREAGFHAHLIKPVDAKKLQELVTVLLSRIR